MFESEAVSELVVLHLNVSKAIPVSYTWCHVSFLFFYPFQEDLRPLVWPDCLPRNFSAFLIPATIKGEGTFAGGQYTVREGMNHSRLHSLIRQGGNGIFKVFVCHSLLVLILGPSLQLEGYVLSKQNP